MIIHFIINYRTQWGESLAVNVGFYGKNEEQKLDEQTLSLRSDNGEIWTGQTDLRQDVQHIRYTYFVKFQDKTIRTESADKPHRHDTAPTEAEELVFHDMWHDEPDDRTLLSSALAQCIHAPGPQPEAQCPPSSSILEIVTTAILPPNHTLALCGSTQAFGCWNPEHSLKMARKSSYEWVLQIPVSRLEPSFSYKFITLQADSQRLVAWESGDDRTFTLPSLSSPYYYIKVETSPVRSPRFHWRGAGVVIPLFSLRSKQSCGIGDFGDLRKLIDWASRVKMNAVQLLPINDTTQTHTWADSYPYNSVSVFALHPMYLDLNALGRLRDARQMEEFEHLREELNALPQMDYERVNRAKTDYMVHFYQETGRQELESAEYALFHAQNRHWLLPYALFCHLRDIYHTADFRQWPSPWHSYTPEKADSYLRNNDDAAGQVAFHCYLQFKLHSQMCDVHRYAREKSIILKGDIPIGISRNSVPAWVDPHYFHFDGQAGAPPDDFAVDGQNWGFPTYNWETMFQDDCDWWKRRLRKMAEYFDAYRIDHVLGFFRIWEIPHDYASGLLGHFSPAKPLSPEEIEKAGLPFDKQRLTRPHISTDLLHKLFGNDFQRVATQFLQIYATDLWDFKPAFDSQKKLYQHTATHPDDAPFYAPLCSLLVNRLFIADPHQPGYHPRIAVQKSEVFQTLTPHEQQAFNRLYDDFFYKRHNAFWYEEAMKKLPLLMRATRMLPCAEDLGMIPECVKWALDELQILSLEIQRMPKEYGVSFGHTEHYPYLSVATLATHDMPPLRLWWHQLHGNDLAQRFYRDVLKQNGNPPAELSAEECRINVMQHLESPSMLCLLALQDWLAISDELKAENVADEQINVPSNPNQYWRYRMHLTLEELICHTDYNEQVRHMIVRSRRGLPEHHTDSWT